MANELTFEAIRGVQSRTAYYTVMVPMKMVPRLFIFDGDDLPPDLRAQRVLSKARVPQIASYLAENWDNYILSSLCASVDGDLTFSPAGKNGALKNVGTLSFAMDARIVLNDGQHRRAAIEDALKTRPALENETISVVIFADRGLARSQQMFADLNMNAVRPSNSLNILYDKRDPLAVLSVEVFRQVPFFNRFLELEKKSLSNRTTKLYTLSSLQQAHEWMVGPAGDKFGEETVSFVIQYWNALYGVLEDWQRLDGGSLNAHDLRQNTVHAHGVLLQAFGILGGALFESFPTNWADKLQAFTAVDWSRRNAELWEGRVMNEARMNGQRRSVLLGAAVLFEAVGLPLEPRMKAAMDAQTQVAA
ncbi:DNA sulfur modification protein DndB [Pseudaestuariivita atlantica]|uniref:DNA sulfur modification protein DndB n=1 Tax=Pseudaestuariivita atlantica TaxID=1317121 RepID=A0A0L1JJD6_9RHOB|nr:DNA sulfur modification protein DndB [Pseudaestuariivita atlantica]KNG91822.1 DNA sulfur modification protein DndB [Pseudaestuariivita atlantica]